MTTSDKSRVQVLKIKEQLLISKKRNYSKDGHSRSHHSSRSILTVSNRLLDDFFGSGRSVSDSGSGNGSGSGSGSDSGSASGNGSGSESESEKGRERNRDRNSYNEYTHPHPVKQLLALTTHHPFSHEIVLKSMK